MMDPNAFTALPVLLKVAGAVIAVLGIAVLVVAMLVWTQTRLRRRWHPSHRWRDGWPVHWHGAHVPQRLPEGPQDTGAAHPANPANQRGPAPGHRHGEKNAHGGRAGEH